MVEPARKDQEQVVEMAHYLRETIADIDSAVHDLQARRNGLAIRLAAIEASGDSAVTDAAADYAERVTENRPYEGAEDTGSLIAEAHRRYVL